MTTNASHPRPSPSAARSARFALGHDYVALLVSQLFVALGGILITRYTDPATKGAFTAAYVWAFTVQLTCGLSAPHAMLVLAPRVSRFTLPSSLSVLITLAIAAVGTALGLLLAIQGVIPPGFPVVLVPVIALAMVAFELHSYRELSVAGPYAVLRLLQAGAFLLAVLALLYDNPTTTRLLLVLLVSYLLPIAFSLARSRHNERPTRLPLRRFFRWSLSAHSGIVLGALASKVDLLGVTALFTATDVGLYAAAVAFPAFITFLAAGFGLVLTRPLRAATDKCSFLRAAAVPVILVSLISALLLLLTATSLTRHVYGPDYLAAVPLLRVLAVAIIPWNLSVLGSQVLLALEAPSQQSMAQLVSVAILLSVTVLAGIFDQLIVAAFGNALAYTTASTLQWFRILQMLKPAGAVP